MLWATAAAGAELTHFWKGELMHSPTYYCEMFRVPLIIGPRTEAKTIVSARDYSELIIIGYSNWIIFQEHRKK